MVRKCFINCFPWCLWSLAEHLKSACIQNDPKVKEFNLQFSQGIAARRSADTPTSFAPRRSWSEPHIERCTLPRAQKKSGWTERPSGKEKDESKLQDAKRPRRHEKWKLLILLLSAGYFWINSTVRRQVKYYQSSGCFVVPKSFSQKRILQTQKGFGPKCLRSVPGGIGL